ncbi:ThuA domain-containing protein [Aquirufa nivalisilvae]|uniref:ThuA domain-containing protein n=1 Tax=Aquirufa nivalisilvae TaxID=2516557 RepID=UPI0022A97384|nr:ThuA domain-containing protein [Aquirufa nivalisilvae]MCZ2480575.1 ThuA domain-containing protein [Aquirufa nivalisilvae]MCZ2482810.1 ThuA domain-containing protein [Aquirufa nivalisilvae]
MKRVFKIIAWTFLGLVISLFALGALFMYKVQNGFPVSYETEKPLLTLTENQPAILLFSKTTGFRHGESIDASKPIIQAMAKKNNWSVFETEEGGVFNEEQLAKFKLVIFNNSTGRVLNDEQQLALEKYVENGGSLMGIHGAGDNSHHWDWYVDNLLGTTFSHHPLSPQFQKAIVTLEAKVDSSLKAKLLATWEGNDEWYVFFNQPKDAQVVYFIDGEKILPSGNMLWMKDKNFGMGKYHPVAWHKTVGKGKTFYTSMGHSKEVWANPAFTQLIEQGILWSLGN